MKPYQATFPATPSPWTKGPVEYDTNGDRPTQSIVGPRGECDFVAYHVNVADVSVLVAAPRMYDLIKRMAEAGNAEAKSVVREVEKGNAEARRVMDRVEKRNQREELRSA